MATQCLGNKRDGTRCTANTNNANGYCHQHQAQVAPAPAAAAAVAPAPAVAATPPAPAPAPAVAPVAATPSSSNNWIPVLLGTATLFAIVCCLVLAIGGYLYTHRVHAAEAAEVVELMPTPTAAPVIVTAPTCPTTGEVKASTDVDVQRLGSEPCAFVWRATTLATTTAICPLGWVCTFDVVNDIVVVHAGVGQTAQIHAGTWRWMGSYPGENSCSLFEKEAAFAASETPSFQVRFQAVTDGSGSPVGPQSCQ